MDILYNPIALMKRAQGKSLGIIKRFKVLKRKMSYVFKSRDTRFCEKIKDKKSF